MPQEGVKVDRDSARAEIRRRTKGRVDIQHQLIKRVHTKKLNEEEEEMLDQKERVNLARFRSGHHPALRHFTVMTGASDTEQCRLCEMGHETTEHLVVDCPALMQDRLRIFGDPRPDLDVLVRTPTAASAYVEIILRRLI